MKPIPPIPTTGQDAETWVRGVPSRYPPEEGFGGGKYKDDESSDIKVTDIRAERNKTIEKPIIGKITTFQIEGTDWIFVWIDTGYELRISVDAFQPIINKLISKEVLERLKGEK